MGSLGRRVGSLEAARMGGERQRVREALRHLSDEELEALEESLLAEARARGKELPPNNPFLEEFMAREAEATERQRRNAEESRRRDREFTERNRALVGLPPLESDE
jgi:hypothetical protein